MTAEISKCEMCGARTVRIRRTFPRSAAKVTAVCELGTVGIVPVHNGADVGYTDNGVEVRGYFSQPGEESQSLQVHRLHECRRSSITGGGR